MATINGTAFLLNLFHAHENASPTLYGRRPPGPYRLAEGSHPPGRTADTHLAAGNHQADNHSERVAGSRPEAAVADNHPAAVAVDNHPEAVAGNFPAAVAEDNHPEAVAGNFPVAVAEDNHPARALAGNFPAAVAEDNHPARAVAAGSRPVAAVAGNCPEEGAVVGHGPSETFLLRRGKRRKWLRVQFLRAERDADRRHDLVPHGLPLGVPQRKQIADVADDLVHYVGQLAHDR